MWIDQQVISEPGSVQTEHFTHDIIRDSKYSEKNLSESVSVGSGYWGNQLKILHSNSAAPQHVRFPGLSPVSSLNLSDRVSIGSGYQPLPIPRASRCWFEPPHVFEDAKHEDSRSGIQDTFGTMKHPTFSNSVTSRLSIMSRNGQNAENSVAQRLEQVVESHQNHIISKNSSSEVIYPSLGLEASVENTEFKHGKVYPDQWLPLNIADNTNLMAPSVVSSVEVVELPAYSINFQLEEQKEVRSKPSNIVSSEKPLDPSSHNPNRRSKSSQQIVGVENTSSKPIHKSFPAKENSCPATIPKETEEISRKKQSPRKVLDRRKTIGIIRYTVPSSGGREKTVLVSVDSSRPSMNMIKFNHGHRGDIFIGNFEGARSLELCQKNNIGAVMNLSNKVLKNQSRMTYYAFPINDLPGAKIAELFNMTSNIIEGHLRAGENILVNCNLGVSRSTTVVLAYIIKKTGMTVDSALALCRRCRPCCNPNHGFIKQLERWHRQTRRTASPEVSYSERGQRNSRRAVVPKESYGEKKESNYWSNVSQHDSDVSVPEARKRKVKRRQRFPFSFAPCFARANTEDASADAMVPVPRQSYSVV